jgi:hypothetical protein
MPFPIELLEFLPFFGAAIVLVLLLLILRWGW